MKELELFDDELEDYLPSAEESETAALIEQFGGNVSAVARALKVSRTTMHKRIKRSVFLKHAVSECREELLDEAEAKLVEAIRRGEPWAICFYLKTQGKQRGYVERGELHVEQKQLTVADFVRRAHEQEMAEKKRLGLNEWDDLLDDKNN
jgi:hypothetical protein